MTFWSKLMHELSCETPTPSIEGDLFGAARRRMVEEQLVRRDIVDPKVLEAMGRVPRERFVNTSLWEEAYDDHPLPIGLGQTISQPYIVALMTQLARLGPKSRVLEVGVGSGYEAAVLAEICEEVYGVEILAPLTEESRRLLADLGYKNVTILQGDGFYGLPEHAPYDAILVAAAPAEVPPPLIEQLAPGGRLVIPVGRFFQELLLLHKREDGTVERNSIIAVQFVPLTREGS